MTIRRTLAARRWLLALAAVLALVGACTASWVHASGGWDCFEKFGQDNLDVSVCPTAETPEHLRYEPGRK